MRHRLHIILAIMSCCFLLLTQSCHKDAGFDEGDVTKNPHGKVITEPGDKTLAGDQGPFPFPPPIPLPLPLPPLPGPGPALIPPPLSDAGGVGGSHGGQKPADTGNPDEGEPEGPNGICGNGVQEVLPDNPACIFDIYGATTDGVDGESHLIGFDLADGGAGLDLGVIPTIHRVSALDFAPDGTLYAVGENEANLSVFASINCQAPHEVVIIGPTGIESLSMGVGEFITDIDFDSVGRLFAYVEIPGGIDEVGIINPATGLYETLGPSGLDELGNGLGSTPFPADMLYHAGNNDISIINKLTGAATPGMNIGFIPPVNDNSPRINALDNDPFTNLMYASIADAASENFLTIINVFSGVITFLADIPLEAPNGLDAIAVNRRSEECDPLATEPALPPGTSCTEECELFESDCADGIDNDQDTLIDCEDPDCLNQDCNDLNGCTMDDTCVFVGGVPTCVGTPVNCEIIIGNECSMDVCQSISSEVGDENFKCNSMLRVPVGDETIFGLCTPDDNCDARNEDGSCDPEEVLNDCIVGRCVVIVEGNEPPFFECEGADKQSVPIVDGGCLDDNPCTADGCEIDEREEDGICTYSILDDVFCENDDNLCTVDLCNVGVCEFIEFAILNTPCDDVDQCTAGDVCDAMGLCEGSTTSDLCDDNNDCTVGEFCNENGGNCANGTAVDDTCLVDADCDNGRPCLNEILGTCSTTTTTTCLLDTDCPPTETCEGETAGQCGCNTDGTDDFTNCFLGVCSGGVCTGEPILVDELCDFVDDVCTTEECTLTGCKSTVMNGPMVCPLLLADLSMDFSTLLTTLGLAGLTCDLGILFCVEGEQDGPCVLNEELFTPCSEASLEAACTVMDAPVDITMIASGLICAQLALEAEAPPPLR